MDQIVEIASDHRHLHKERGFLIVSQHQQEIGRIPLDNILAVIIHAHGITYSNSLMVSLAKQGTLMVLCGSNHAPEAVLWPLTGHGMQGARMRSQYQAKAPLIKQLWKQIVRQKIAAQADCLAALGQQDAPVRALIRSVRAGDDTNIEAQAARRYWPLLMGEEFRRDSSASGPNAQLNYGYTILRSLVMRSVVAAGLNPTIGLFHSNRGNSFALADDLMEPFRPLVDAAVYNLHQSGQSELTREGKQALTRLISLDMRMGETLCPLSQAVQRLCFSLATSFEQGKPELDFPEFPSALEIAALGKTGEPA